MEADLTLLDAARRMNQEALAEIFDRYSSALYKYALRLCNDAMLADQVVGDVFARLLDRLSAGHGPLTSLRSYLYQMAYHLIVDEARYWRGRVALDIVDFLRHDHAFIHSNLENRILFETISCAIQNELTDYQRHVIILRFLEGFSLYETAAILGKSVNIIKAVQNRAIVTLRTVAQNQIIENSVLPPESGIHSNRPAMANHPRG